VTKLEVLSDRLPWPAGTVLSSSDLEGCNIMALIAGGHLSPAPIARRPAAPDVESASGPKEL
jgi:hypothetical protein